MTRNHTLKLMTSFNIHPVYVLQMKKKLSNITFVLGWIETEFIKLITLIKVAVFIDYFHQWINIENQNFISKTSQNIFLRKVICRNRKFDNKRPNSLMTAPKAQQSIDIVVKNT